MRIERLFIFLMVLSIFLDDFIVGGNSAEARRASSFDFYYYYIIFLGFLTFFFTKRKKLPFLPSWFLQPLLILFVVSIVTGYFNGKIRFSMFKQIIGISFSAVAYYNLHKYTHYDIKKVFNIYLKIAFGVALIGVIEELMLMRGMYQYFSNVKRVSLGFYRVYSIMGEPYFLAVALIPALYYYLNKIIGVKEFREWKNIMRFGVIFLCYFFTFSSAGIFGLGIMLLLILYNYGYFTPTNGRFILFLLLSTLVLPRFDVGGIFSLKELEIRATDSYKAFSTGKALSKDDAADLNSSTFALYSNYIIALESFKSNPLTGGGLGTHEKTYDDYFEEKFGALFKLMFGHFNAKDGNSLFIRLMSETGLLGLFLIFYFIFRFFLGRRNIHNPELTEFIIINQGIFVVFVIRLMRTGNYIGQGFFFFFFLYYLTYVYVKKNSLKATA